jgi:tetrathionate reductase subunit B
MTKWAMVIDYKKCVGCEACVAACIAENRRGPALNEIEMVGEGSKSAEDLEYFKLRTQVHHVVYGTYPDVREFFMHRICLHCDNPPCAAVCPTGATYQRPDGIVLVDEEKCIGCRYCEYACPYNARFWDDTFNKMDKCTFCEHLLEVGQEPACVNTCPAHARIFGDLEDPDSEVSQLVRSGAVRAGTKNRSEAHVYFVLPKGYEELASNPVFEPEGGGEMPEPKLKGFIDEVGWVVTGLALAGLVGHMVYWRFKKPVEKVG